MMECTGLVGNIAFMKRKKGILRQGGIYDIGRAMKNEKGECAKDGE
jgi:hypothetical protein